MIVKCDACQTRFKIPDEKVTEKGVKVRCTKCGNTFRVAREGSPAEAAMRPPVAMPPAPPAAPAFDPFAAIGQSEEDPFGADPTRMVDNPLAAPPPLPARPSPPPPAASGNLHEELFGSLEPADRTRTQTKIEHDRSAFGGVDANLTTATGTTGTFPIERDHALFEMPQRPAGGLLDEVPEAPAPEPAAPEPQERLGGLPPIELETGSPPDWGAPASAPTTGWGAPEPGAAPDWGAPDPGATAGWGTPDPSFDAPASAPAPAPPPLPQRAATPEPEPDPAPPPAPADEDDSPEPVKRAARLVSGAVVNLALLGILLIGLAAVGNVYLNEGRFDWNQFNPKHLAQLWAPPPQVVTRDVSNGLYDTQAGHPVLFVRGEVENRAPRGNKVKVEVDIFDGDQLLRSSEVFAGASPTPEELSAIGGPAELDALTQKLNQGAKVLPPRASAPFLVAFYEYPSELNGLRLKVTAHVVP